MNSAKPFWPDSPSVETPRSSRTTKGCSDGDTPSTLISYRWWYLGRSGPGFSACAINRPSRDTRARIVCTTHFYASTNGPTWPQTSQPQCEGVEPAR